MEFIKAKPEDEAEILALYEAAKTSPYTTWNEYYPAKEEADADLAAGTLYVLKEAGAVIGTASVAPENEIEDFSGWEFPEPARRSPTCPEKASKRSRGSATPSTTPTISRGFIPRSRSFSWITGRN